MSEVTVVFAGVLLLGPGRPYGEPYEQPGPFYAVSPPCTRRRTARAPDEITHGFIPFHLPAIVTSATLAIGSREPDDTLFVPRQESANEVAYNFWFPFRERLEFVIDGNPTGRVEYEHTPDALSGDVDLIADMRRIWPEVSTMPPSTADPAADPRGIPFVHGQVFIPGGKVSSRGMPKRVYFDPPRTTSRVEFAIVPEAAITFTAERRIDILSTSLDSGDRLDTISFDVTGDIEIRVENGDPKDIRKKTTLPGYDKQRERELRLPPADVDFELFYAVLAPAERSRLPVPVDITHALIRDCYVVMTDSSSGSG